MENNEILRSDKRHEPENVKSVLSRSTISKFQSDFGLISN